MLRSFAADAVTINDADGRISAVRIAMVAGANDCTGASIIFVQIFPRQADTYGGPKAPPRP
jgi:hypothetical protein